MVLCTYVSEESQENEVLSTELIKCNNSSVSPLSQQKRFAFHSKFDTSSV